MGNYEDPQYERPQLRRARQRGRLRLLLLVVGVKLEEHFVVSLSIDVLSDAGLEGSLAIMRHRANVA